MYNKPKTTTLLAAGLMSLLFLQTSVAANDCGHEGSSSEIVSYEFNDIELSSVMQLASLAAGKKVIGMELLTDKKVSATAEEVNVTAFVDALLLVNGFNFDEEQDSWIITKM